MNPNSGLLEWPEPAPPTERQRRRSRWFVLLMLPAMSMTVAMLTISIRSLPKSYEELRYAISVFALVLAIVVIGLAVWMLAHEDKPIK